MDNASNIKTSKKVLVLYSGGRDSSATAVELSKEGYQVKLFTYQAGLPELTGQFGSSAPEIRLKELLEVFPKNIDQHRVIEGNIYLIRKLAIEKTNSEHIVYPIALALAVHCGAIKYCLENNIKTIASGYSGYQAKMDRYIEQREDFVNLTKDFLNEYNISYKLPVIEKSKEEIMDILERYGISSNSLENKSIFGGIQFDVVYAHHFWESSIPICREYLKKIKRVS